MTQRKTIAQAPSGENTSLAGTEKVPVSGNQFTLISTIAAYIRTLAQTLTNKTISLTSNTLTGTTAQFNTALSDNDFATLAGSETLSTKTLASPMITGAITLPDDVRQTFNPGATNAGLNVGAIAGDPSTPSNGDLWYDSTANELTARINSANVALGAGGGSGDVVGPASATDNAIARFDTTTGKLIQNSAITIDDTGAISFPDNIRQTFNPGADAAGLNVGAIAGDPGTPSNGDLWYDGTANELTARINGANVALGAGGGGSVATDSIWDAKGDLAVGTGANTAARLAVGTNGQYPIADSAESTGVKWATGARELITSSTPSGTGTVTFSSISGVYTFLVIEYIARSTNAANSVQIAIEFNADTTAGNYRYVKQQAFGGSSTNVTGADDRLITDVSAANSPTNSPGIGTIYIPYYAQTTFNKMARSNWGYRNDSTTNHQVSGHNSLEWENTAAITQIDLKLSAGNYVAGSQINLYGVY